MGDDKVTRAGAPRPELRSLWMIEQSVNRHPGSGSGKKTANIKIESGSMDESDVDRYVFFSVDILVDDTEAAKIFDFSCRYGLTFNEEAAELPNADDQLDALSREIIEPVVRQALVDAMARCGVPAFLLPIGAFDGRGREA